MRACLLHEGRKGCSPENFTEDSPKKTGTAPLVLTGGWRLSGRHPTELWHRGGFLRPHNRIGRRFRLTLLHTGP